jgi:hypothetical protein
MLNERETKMNELIITIAESTEGFHFEGYEPTSEIVIDLTTESEEEGMSMIGEMFTDLDIVWKNEE